MEGKKRKRDSDKPRITYHAANRTFDRLFKEESLEETKDAVRQKLHLPPDTVIQLEQLREGQAIDLEDDDDFEAFRVLAHSMSSVDVRVTVISPAADTAEAESHEIVKKKRKKKKGHSSIPSQMQGSDADPSSNASLADGRKQKNIVEPSTPSASNTDSQPKRKKRKNISGHVPNVDVSHLSDAQALAERDKILRDVLLVLGGGEEPRPGILGIDVLPNETEPAAISTRQNGKKKKGSKSSENIDGAFATHSPETLAIKESPPSGSGPKKRKTDTDTMRMHEATSSSIRDTEKSGSSSATPFPEQLAGAILKMSEITQRHMMENTTAEKRRNRSVKPATDPVGVFTDSTVPSSALIDSTPKTRFPVKRPTGKKKSEQLLVDSRQDDQVSPTAKSAKGKQKEPPSERDNEIIKAAFSRVLAKNPSNHSVVEQTDHKKTNSAKIPVQAESVDKEVRSPVRKYKSKSRSLQVPENLQPRASGQKSVEPESSVVRGQSDLVVVPTSPKLRRASLTSSITSRSTKGKGTKPDLLPCPVCLQAPFHLRYQCPIILAGHDAIKARLRELKEKEADRRGQLIEELETMLKSRGDETAKDRKSNVNADSTFLSSVPVQAAQQTPSDSSGHVADTSLPDSATLISSDKTISVSRRPNIPVGAQISEVTIERLNEGSSNEDTDNDSDDSNEQFESIDGEPSSKNRAASTPIPLYANIDLEALVRGPAFSRHAIADILADDATQEDEEQEDVVLEEDEENDSKFRHLSTSSDGDFDAESSEASLDDPVENHRNQQVDMQGQSSSYQDTAESISFVALANRGESPGINQTGDAAFSEVLAEDNVALKMATDDSEDDTRVAPSAENEDENDTSPKRPFSQGKEALNLRSSDVTQPATTTIDLTMAQSTPANECNAAEVDQTIYILPPTVESSQVETVVDSILQSPLPSVAHNQKLDEEDPIEPADDFLKSLPIHHKVLSPIPRVPNSVPQQSTPSSPVIKRMRTRSGKVPSADIELAEHAFEADKDDYIPPGSSRGKHESRLVEKTASDDSGKRDLHPTPKTPTPSTESMPPPPTPPTLSVLAQHRSQQTPKPTHETVEKLVSRREEARRKAEPASPKAATKRGGRKASTKPSIRPVVLINSSSTRPPATLRPRSSLTKWTTLQPSSPYVEQDSLMVDQLHSSPIERKTCIPPKKKGAARRPDPPPNPRIEEPFDVGQFDAAAATSQEALFLPSQSQVSCPFPQRKSDSLESQAGDKESESESEEEVVQAQRPSKTRSSVSYRSLTDIASQETLFRTHLLTPAALPSSAVTGNKTRDIFGGVDMDNEDSDDTDESSVLEEEKSHIPKARRAGVGVQRKRAI